MTAAVFLLALLFGSEGAAESAASAALCIDTRPRGELRAPHLPSSGAFAFRVDDGPWVPIPSLKGAMLTAIASGGSHRLAVRRGGKPYETIRFSFSGAPMLSVRQNSYGFFEAHPRRKVACPWPVLPASASEAGRVSRIE